MYHSYVGMYKVHIAWCDCSGGWTSYLKPCILSSCYGPQWSHCITKSINLLIASFFAFSTKEPHPLKHASESGASYWVSNFSFVINPPLSHRKFGTRQGACMKMCTQRPKGGGAIKCEPPTPSKNLHLCTFNVAKPRCCKATWSFLLYIHKIRSMINELSGRQLREEISPFIELNSPTDDGTCPVSCEFSS